MSYVRIVFGSSVPASIAVSLALLLSGCANHVWAPRPGMSVADLGPSAARCRLMARHSGGGFEAAGSARFVLAAELGNAIGEAVRTNHDFNDCMEANGWLIADSQSQSAQAPVAAQPVQLLSKAATPPQEAPLQQVAFTSTPAEPAPAASQIAAIKTRRDECIAAVRSNDRYAPLRTHLPNSFTGRFNIYQVMEPELPTRAEISLIAALEQDARPCQDDFLAAMAVAAPTMTTGLNQQVADADNITFYLLKGQMSWGEWATRIWKIQEASLSGVEAVRF